ncbi:hypothetical protein MC885_004901, partial [Smutsia gigantea]
MDPPLCGPAPTALHGLGPAPGPPLTGVALPRPRSTAVAPPPPPAAAISRPPGPLRSVRRAGSESALGPVLLVPSEPRKGRCFGPRSIIQDMNSDDPVIQQKAVLETEKRLLSAEDVREEDGCRTTLNKTVISPPQAPMKNADDINPEAFLASVEKDAKERARRRRENQALARALKDKGNEAFVKGDYESAVLCYSEGLEKLKDMKVLYTNRAQAYIKLGDYQKALADCDWALKCDEKCTKAYFHMGKAHLALKNYSGSRECYQRISEINPQLQTQVKGYLNQVDLQEKADLQEKEALEFLDSGKGTAMTTKSLLDTLSKPDQIPLFYAGGIEILTELMQDCKPEMSSWTSARPVQESDVIFCEFVSGTERTLFRIHNGFSIISENEVIRRSLSTEAKDAVEETICLSVLRLWQAVCRGNGEPGSPLIVVKDSHSSPWGGWASHWDGETGLVSLLSPSAQGGHLCLAEENQRLLVVHPIIGRLLPTLSASGILAVRWQSLALLLQLSQTEHGRGLIAGHLDLARLTLNGGALHVGERLSGVGKGLSFLGGRGKAALSARFPWMLTPSWSPCKVSSLGKLSVGGQSTQVITDFCRLLEALVSFLDFSDKKAISAMELLTDLALEERFQVWFQANLPGALPALTGVLKRDPKTANAVALCQCIAIMGVLGAEATVQRQMAASEEFGEACLGLMVFSFSITLVFYLLREHWLLLNHLAFPKTLLEARCEEDVDLFREVVYTLLGLMMNLCLQHPLVSERAAGVLSRTLSSPTIVEEALRAGVVKKMIKFLKTGGQTASRYAVKTLAICTNSYHEAREEVIRLDKKFHVLVKLLGMEDEVLAGNAALCLGNCMEVPRAAASLLKTDIVQVLLKLAGGDVQKTTVRLNAGIALSKLCSAEPRYTAAGGWMAWAPGHKTPWRGFPCCRSCSVEEALPEATVLRAALIYSNKIIYLSKNILKFKKFYRNIYFPPAPCSQDPDF